MGETRKHMFAEADGLEVEVRLSATIILIRDGELGLEVLLMRRNSRLNFCAGFWVFPGGAVEERDNAPSIEQCMKNAAVRETQEEAGLLLDDSELLHISRWVTPEGAAKRFDTWFYVAAASDDDVCVDGSEITESLWSRPADAIARHQQNEVELLPPTLISLMSLAQFDYVDEALAYYRDKPVLEYLPKVSFLGEQLQMLYPGDDAYASADASIETARHRCLHTPNGWVYVNDIGVPL